MSHQRRGGSADVDDRQPRPAPAPAPPCPVGRGVERRRRRRPVSSASRRPVRSTAVATDGRPATGRRRRRTAGRRLPAQQRGRQAAPVPATSSTSSARAPSTVASPQAHTCTSQDTDSSATIRTWPRRRLDLERGIVAGLAAAAPSRRCAGPRVAGATAAGWRPPRPGTRPAAAGRAPRGRRPAPPPVGLQRRVCCTSRAMPADVVELAGAAASGAASAPRPTARGGGRRRRTPATCRAVPGRRSGRRRGRPGPVRHRGRGRRAAACPAPAHPVGLLPTRHQRRGRGHAELPGQPRSRSAHGRSRPSADRRDGPVHAGGWGGREPMSPTITRTPGGGPAATASRRR